MTGTFAGQYCMAGFLEIQWAPWQRTLFTRFFALGPSLFIAIAAESGLDTLDEWLNVQQSVQLPFALLPLMFFNCNPRVMGEFVLGKKWEMFFWIASFGIITVNVYLTVSFVGGVDISDGIKYTLIVGSLIVYLGFCAWLMADFCRQKRNKFAIGRNFKLTVDGNDESESDSVTGIQSIETEQNGVYIDH